ncbi:MAG: imidazolonepropionase [Sporichthyaceae bacterium]
MTSFVLTDISTLVTNDPYLGAAPLGELRDAALIVEGSRVSWVGPAASAPAADTRVSAGGGCVLPGFVDSHTHLVFAGDRLSEFTERAAGRPYSAGGIASTVEATRAAADEVLEDNLSRLLREAFASGTTTVEIKSGYGLTPHDEERALRIAAQFTDQTTFLGAHVVPPEFADDRDGYLDLLVGPMLTAAAPHARWIDVFCDAGAFDADETRTILRAGEAAFLSARLHANQLDHGPGVRLAVEFNAASADHCTYLTDADVDALAQSTTVATLLPAAEFSTRSPYANARRLLDAGVTVALATDCNPGSAYTTSMPFAIALAVRELGMSPAEAIWAATAGGAAALRRSDVGNLRPGSRADFVVLAAPDPGYLAYRPGVQLISGVWKNGRG